MASLNAVILAAGKGTRMKSDIHKVLHPIGGMAMIDHVLNTLSVASSGKRVVVVGDKREQVEAALSDVDFALQENPNGTGHAVQCAEGTLKGVSGDVLVLCGDVPLIKAETISALIDASTSTSAKKPAIVVLGFRAANPTGYGRLVLDGKGDLETIVEEKDASDAVRGLDLCNSGTMVFDGTLIFDILSELKTDNAAGELYLTDAIAIAKSRGLRCTVVECSEDEVIGVNSRADLAKAEKIFQTRMRNKAMDNGATLLDPDTTYFSADTELGQDVTIAPNVVFGPNVRIGNGTIIHAHCHIEGATVAQGCQIGPFARLRPGTDLHDEAKVGNFCEVKKATIEEGAKVNHLSYIGDARVGAKANIGAGTITCNYDGFNKSFTDIGAGAFIGSNTSLVAPVKIGDGALVGAGSVITKDVGAGDMAVVRAEHRSIKGWAKKFREKQLAKKSQKG
jgi:bifunctional UDP-N-acetylglucosamine pyrophosphorylase/glucosamine-1-phosphate N-acetyltransferase